MSLYYLFTRKIAFSAYPGGGGRGDKPKPRGPPAPPPPPFLKETLEYFCSVMMDLCICYRDWRLSQNSASLLVVGTTRMRTRSWNQPIIVNMIISTLISRFYLHASLVPRLLRGRREKSLVHTGAHFLGIWNFQFR